MNPAASPARPTSAQIRRWRKYVADERAEGELYSLLAQKRDGEDREILLRLAEAEKRHEEHWTQLLGDELGNPRRSMSSRIMAFMAKYFGSVFVLALAQRSEGRSPYATDPDATPTMAADEAIHEEIVRALANHGREKISGNFRAAVFGANDGLVSNLALVLGVGASGAPNSFILLSGLAGLLAGALSMGAGEYVSVRSQRELLSASRPTQITLSAAPDLNLEANELELVYLARGMSREAAKHRVKERFGELDCDCDPSLSVRPETERADQDELQTVGTGLGAATSSFLFFSSGAIVPVIPYLLGITGIPAVITAAVLVGIALLFTGSVVGVLSGASPLKRALRQLGIGWGAATITYLLGLIFGVSAG